MLTYLRFKLEQFYNTYIGILVFTILLGAAFVFSHQVRANSFSHWYSEEELSYVQKVYGANLQQLLFTDVLPFLTLSERRTLSTIKMHFPLRGHDAGLFEFAMQLKTGEMYVSALSVKFFDDISIALAWYEDKNKDKQKIVEYLLSLSAQYSQASAPLKALDVPEKAWKLSEYVNDVSQKSLKSGLLFIVLHELSHWHFKHAPYSKISALQAQQQEIQADAFALQVMARMSIIPYGMSTWLMMLGLGQTDSGNTHPVTSSRLIAIANQLEKNPKSFIDHENISTMSDLDVLQVSADIKKVGEVIRSLKR